MTEKVFVWTRSHLTAVESEALAIVAIAILWGWKPAAWAMLVLSALLRLSALAFAKQWRKAGL